MLTPSLSVCAQSLSEKVLIATLDCDKHKPICKQNNVSAYPSLRFWVQGKIPQERDFKYHQAAEGVYNDWHGAATTAKGLKKLKEFVLERLGNGEEPPDPGPFVEKAPPAPPKAATRPKGWWKNPEKYKKDAADLPKAKGRAGMGGLDITESTTLGKGNAEKLQKGEIKPANTLAEARANAGGKDDL